MSPTLVRLHQTRVYPALTHDTPDNANTSGVKIFLPAVDRCNDPVINGFVYPHSTSQSF